MNIKTSLPAAFLRAALILALTAGVYSLCQSTPESEEGTVAGVIMNLPETVNGFVGEDQPVSEAEIRMLPKDTGFAKKAYKDDDGDQIASQIVLAGGEKRSIHRPEICLPAQGWNLKTRQTVPITLSDGRTLDVMQLMISKPVEIRPGVTKELSSVFLYWFVGKDMTTPSHLKRLAHANWDKVVHNINHRWAYVIVSAPVLEGFTPNGKNQAETMKMLESFVGEIAPKIMEPSVHLPTAPKS
jgi:EpsI family protein